jgi:hypothetical protein
MKMLSSALCLCLAASPAFAADNAAAAPAGANAMPDMTKMGPGTRKLQHEAEDKKAIAAMMDANMATMEKGDVEAAANLVDFPVLMTTDSPTTGEASSVALTRDQWVAMMKPFMQPTPKDMKFSVKNNITMLTDSLGQVVSDCSMTMGKMKMKWKSADLVVLKNGKWLVKSMTEGGWGDLPVPGAQQAKAKPTTK